MGYSYILIYVLLQLNFVSYSTTKKLQRCNVIINHADFNNCNNREAEKATFSGPMGYNKNRVSSTDGTEQNKTESVCRDEVICRKLFNIVHIRLQSFASKILAHISDMLHQCCGECAKYNTIDVFSDISHVNNSLMNSSDIIFPIFGRSFDVNELFGFHYIPVFEVPSAYYFTLQKSQKEMAIKLIMSCLNMWPLMIICILMAFIAGFIAWIMETWNNADEFPRPFHIGVFEGFWWSFVSMTTVGYGDKAPKSRPGRMFAVLWILIGITICSIFTAFITSAIIDVRFSENPELQGKVVGALTYRMQDSIMIAQHKGIIRAIEYNDTVIGIVKLIKKLQRGDINGFLINRSTYYYFTREITESVKYKDPKASIQHIRMSRTEKLYRGEQLVTGMLVKNRDDYEYFKKYFEYNWLQIQECYSYNLNYKDKKFELEFVSPIEGLFYPFLYGALGILGVILFFGSFYEARKYIINRRLLKTTNKDTNGYENTVVNIRSEIFELPLN